MASDVQICNLALAHIGAEAQIAALDPTESEEARYCTLYYEDLRDSLLREHEWGFAIKVDALADLVTPPYSWAYRYAYPSDCLTAIEIIKSADSDQTIPFEIASDGASGKVVLTDSSAADLRYISRVTDPNAFDAGFRMALSWNLAFSIAEAITGSSQKRADAANIYANILAKVKAADAGEGSAEALLDASWLSART